MFALKTNVVPMAASKGVNSIMHTHILLAHYINELRYSGRSITVVQKGSR